MNNPYIPGLRAVVCGGLVAGTLDIFMAAWIGAMSPVFIMKVIASGLYGAAAFHGDAGVATLGFFLQWIMSLIIAAVYVAAAHWIRPFVRLWIPAGIAYGIVIYFVMNYVVVPLSAAPFGPPSSVRGFTFNLLAMILFGLIVAFFAWLFLRRQAASRSAS